MKTYAVIGGGAAGFFGAIACAEENPNDRVLILEKSKQLLSKVRISGGGRCNVTHACFDPSRLIQNYPRGGKALLGPFHRFQPRDTIQWFENRGVTLKTEEDGRMFPITDNSETIINCLMHEAKTSGVEILTQKSVQSIEKQDNHFILFLSDETSFTVDKVLMATGNSPKAYDWLVSLGHTIVSLVPSLFTFNVPDSPLLDLSGLSLSKVIVKIAKTSLEQTGPILLTHWGFSGPAVLKLSAWGARILHDTDYQATIFINWIPDYSSDEVKKVLLEQKQRYPQRHVLNEPLFDLPRNLWKRFALISGIQEEQRWATTSHQQLHALQEKLQIGKFQLQGKTTYKQEFVTCGGVDLDEVNFKTMESKVCPGLYFAGEVLNIDGVTGGFNFQNAWTTGWIAGHSMKD